MRTGGPKIKGNEVSELRFGHHTIQLGWDWITARAISNQKVGLGCPFAPIVMGAGEHVCFVEEERTW